MKRSIAFPWEAFSIFLNLVGILCWIFFSRSDVRLLKAREYYLGAIREYKEENYFQARHIFRTIATKFPDAPEAQEAAYRSARLSLREIGDFSSARKEFEAYLYEYPQGRFRDDARNGLEFILAIPPEDEFSARLHLAAEYLEEKGRLEEALELTDRVIGGGAYTSLTPRTLDLRSRLAGQVRTTGATVSAAEAPEI